MVEKIRRADPLLEGLYGYDTELMIPAEEIKKLTHITDRDHTQYGSLDHGMRQLKFTSVTYKGQHYYIRGTHLRDKAAIYNLDPKVIAFKSEQGSNNMHEESELLTALDTTPARILATTGLQRVSICGSHFWLPNFVETL